MDAFILVVAVVAGGGGGAWSNKHQIQSIITTSILVHRGAVARIGLLIPVRSTFNNMTEARALWHRLGLGH